MGHPATANLLAAFRCAYPIRASQCCEAPCAGYHPSRPFEGWASALIISLTSLPDLRDNQYIAQAQCSHLFITPLFHGFYL